MLMHLVRKTISIFYANFVGLTLIKLNHWGVFFVFFLVLSNHSLPFAGLGPCLWQLLAIVKVCSKIVGIPFEDLSHVHHVRSLKKIEPVLADPTHPLHSEVLLLPPGQSGRRLKTSFVPAARGFLNDSLWSYVFSYYLYSCCLLSGLCTLVTTF